MAKCLKCGNELKEGMKFCLRCGQPVGHTVQPLSPTVPPRPMRPQPLKAVQPGQHPQPVQPQRPVMPQQPVMPTSRPMRPKPMTAPAASQQPEGKGFLTNAVRTVANAVTGGALNRDIAREQQAILNQQQRAAQGEINDARQAQQNAEQAQMRAEQDAERAADRRAMELVDGVDVVRGRAIWNIQPGEIARKIKESELEEIEKLKGIIVQEGCTAIIFANGELVSTLSAGAYLFYKSVEEEQAALKAAVEKAEKELAEQERRARDLRRQTAPTFRQLGIVGEIDRGFNWLSRIIFGEKKNETKDIQQKRKMDYARLLARLTQAPVMSAYLVSDRYVTLTFGGHVNEEGGIDFTPYKIPTHILDVEIGVSLQLKVSDIHAFAANYLADRNSARVSMFHTLLNSSIENLLRQSLRNTDYEQTGLAPETINRLKLQIQQLIGQHLQGIECVQVLQITDSNADFERFRSIERELFNTEKELEYLQRTGEFRNRLESETNSQQIQSAQNAEQLRYALQQINKDQLLHDDELEEFVQLLESQKRIREAKTQEEEHEALEDLRKNRLVKQDEMEELEHQLAQKKIPREEVTQIMRIQSQQKIEEERLRAEWNLGDQRQDHDWEREDLERRRNWGIEDEERERQWMQDEREYDRRHGRLKAEDDYDFEKMMRQRNIDLEDHDRQRQEQLQDEDRAYDRQRQEKMDDDLLDANRSQRQIDKLQAMAQMQAQLDAQKYQHEESIATVQANRDIEVEKAGKANAVEQAEFFRQQQLKAQEEAREREANARADRNSDMDRMERMFDKMGDKMVGMSQNLMGTQQQRAEEYRQQAQAAQNRMEHAQEQALNAIGGVATAAAGNIGAFNGGNASQQPTQQSPQPEQPAPRQQPELMECQCYQCGHVIRIAPGTPQCPDCGAPFAWE